MTTIVLIIHILIAIALIGMVLIQRSEGGALGIGGGGGGGFMSSRGTANALTKTTSLLAAAFFATSITLTLLAKGGGSGSVLDRLDAPAESEIPGAVDGDGLSPSGLFEEDAAAPDEGPTVPGGVEDAPQTAAPAPQVPAGDEGEDSGEEQDPPR
ncbi:MAG: preprotein translocase subunit SecG [Parvularculaceae bacterium]